MRHVALVVSAALAIALVLVLVVGEEEAGEDQSPTVTTPEQRRPPTSTSDTPTTPRKTANGRRQDVGEIERAVALYVERAERGEVDAQGLPTSDELSIEDVEVSGREATARLAGGAVLALRREGGRWEVSGLERAPRLRPTPPQ